ncbi:MAG: hypothetical protein ACM3JJ_05585 [Hyphomicrobiales bacterium]
MKGSRALLLLLVLSVAGNVYLGIRARNAEERAKRAEARSIAPVYQRVLLSEDEIRMLKAAGLTDPVAQLRSDLAAHADLIPFKGVVGGTMGFYDRDGIVLLPGRYVYAPADDGHVLAHTILRYDVGPGGKIAWKLLDAHLD